MISHIDILNISKTYPDVWISWDILGYLGISLLEAQFKPLASCFLAYSYFQQHLNRNCVVQIILKKYLTALKMQYFSQRQSVICKSVIQRIYYLPMGQSTSKFLELVPVDMIPFCLCVMCNEHSSYIWNSSGSSPQKDIRGYPRISEDLRGYPLIQRTSENIF